MTNVDVISVGAGTQSSVLAMIQEADYYIFADTGDETQETYDFINDHLIPKMNEVGKELIIVTWWDLYDKPYSSMREYYLDKDGIPTRQFRSCTERFKIRTIRKYLRNQGVEKAIMHLGITTDEIHRVRGSDVQWIENSFPLIDRGLSRDDIIEMGKDIFGVVPPKSGCYYCPFITSERFFQYGEKHGDQVVLDVIEMEENAMKNNPKLKLFGKYPVKTMWNGRKRQLSLDDFDYDGDRCDSGMCFT